MFLISQQCSTPLQSTTPSRPRAASNQHGEKQDLVKEAFHKAAHKPLFTSKALLNFEFDFLLRDEEKQDDDILASSE